MARLMFGCMLTAALAVTGYYTYNYVTEVPPPMPVVTAPIKGCCSSSPCCSGQKSESASEESECCKGKKEACCEGKKSECCEEGKCPNKE